MNLPFELNSIALPLTFLAAILSLSSIRSGKPSSAILGRWSLWVCASTGLAILLNELGISSRPMWATALFCFLVWMLVETLYNWVAIDALSRSGLPLFPKYKASEGGSEWPVDRAYISLRETLREEQFHAVSTAVGQFGSDDVVRCPVYENADRHLRIYLYFMPTSSGSLQAFYTIVTLLDDGSRVVTDNVYMPFGGFYPENMLIERRPLIRSLGRLLKLHKKRLHKIGGKELEWTGNPVDDLNNQQREIEQLNVSLGFLVELAQREEYGSISREGRYRLWKEIWMLNYLGKPFSY